MKIILIMRATKINTNEIPKLKQKNKFGPKNILGQKLLFSRHPLRFSQMGKLM